MAIAAVLDFDGGTLEQYDEALKLMGLESGGKGPTGALFHWIAKTDNGVRVTDVWTTQDAFDKFAAEQIGPISAQVGFPEPKVNVYEVHSYLTAG